MFLGIQVTRDDVTFWIAVAGFGISVYTLVSSWIKSRENYRIELIDYAYRRKDVIQFLICISNNSDSPLTIVDISVFGVICELEPKSIWGDPGQWDFRHTPDFPLCIPAHSSQYAYLEFVDDNYGFPKLAPGKTVMFEIHSTDLRVQKTVTLGNESHYLHTRGKSRYHQARG